MNFNQFMLARETPAFQWGSWDCVCFAAKAIEAQTGVNPMQYVDYTSKRQALRRIAEAGSLADLVRKHIGEPLESVEKTELRNGDILLLHWQGNDLLGVFYNRWAVVLNENGKKTWLWPSEIDMAWRPSTCQQ